MTSNASASPSSMIAFLLEAGTAALEAGDLPTAEHHLREAVQLDPGCAPAWRALAATQTGARQAMCLRWAEHAASQKRRPSLVGLPRRPRWSPQGMRRAGLAATGAAGALLVVLLASDLQYRERMLPGVHVGPHGVGAMSRAQAARQIVGWHSALASEVITVRAGDMAWRLRLGALLHDDGDTLARRAFAYGHEGSFWRRSAQRLRAVGGGEYRLDPSTAVPDVVHQVIAAIATGVARERRDAELLHGPDGWTIVPEQIGVALKREAAAKQLMALIDEAETGARELDLPVIEARPRLTTAKLEPLRQALAALSAAPLTLTVGEQQWTLDRSLLMRFTDPADLATLQPHEAAIGRELEGIAAAIAVAPQASAVVREGGRVRALMPGRAGQQLDHAAALQSVVEALRSDAGSVALPIVASAPPPGEMEQLGLVAELGRGESQFLTYASPERDANVATGGGEIDGVLLAPGEIFSFTGTIRDITWDEGYRWGEMIEAGIVVPSLGGGICQVSTTVFRAAFWSGLEIVERHNHTWRLPWYEVDAPPGMDATIALGGPDLKFRNNTGHHILISVETDLEQKKQTVVIYGTPDGRRVEMQPVAGGNIAVQRHVIQGDGQVAGDVFVSAYTQ